MNKLEEQKETLVKEYMKGNDDDAFESGYSDGFDAAIALDLPVKFAVWLNKNYITSKGRYRHRGDFYKNDKKLKVERELYNYWITNIYKP